MCSTLSNFGSFCRNSDPASIALQTLECEHLLSMKAFITTKVVGSQNSDCRCVSGIFNLYSKSKENGHFKKHGRLESAGLTEIVTAAKDAMSHCTNNSNTFKLDHLKMVYSKKKG